MVSKITCFDYLNANKRDYQEFAHEFYKIMAKKYHLKLEIDFNNNIEEDIGYTISICSYDMNLKPIYFHHLDFNINQLFKENTNYSKRFLEFVNCLYHELYHVLIIELANKESCFNLTSLFSAIDYADNEDGMFWNINYNRLDEEIKAYIYGYKASSSFMKKYYPDVCDAEFNKKEIAKYITSKNFYNHYFYEGKRLSKTATLNKMINNFNYEEDNPYPIIINKVFNLTTKKIKTIDELVFDYEFYLSKYPNKLKEIESFYATLVTEKYLDNESFTINNNFLYLVQLGLNLKKKTLNNLKQIHPIKLHSNITKNYYIHEQQNVIKHFESSINGLF